MSVPLDEVIVKLPLPAPTANVPQESTPAVPPGVFAVSIATEADALRIHVLETATDPAVIATVVPLTRSG